MKFTLEELEAAPDSARFLSRDVTESVVIGMGLRGRVEVSCIAKRMGVVFGLGAVSWTGCAGRGPEEATTDAYEESRKSFTFSIAESKLFVCLEGNNLLC